MRKPACSPAIRFIGMSQKDLPVSDMPLIKLRQEHTAYCLSLHRDQVVIEALETPADAVVTDKTNVVLCVYTADCLPILLWHPSGVIGAVHAGRKGTELGVLTNTLQSMKAAWGIDRDVKLWFGPAICKDCYEIDRTTNSHYDLRANNRRQVEAFFDVKSFKIIENEHCTFHHHTEWHSYRREGKGCQMNYSYIWLGS